MRRLHLSAPETGTAQGWVLSTPSTSAATLAVCCCSSRQRGGPGTSGCVVAASARVSPESGSPIFSKSCRSRVPGSRSGSGARSHEPPPRGAGWWEAPCPDLERARGGQLPRATRQRSLEVNASEKCPGFPQVEMSGFSPSGLRPTGVDPLEDGLPSPRGRAWRCGMGSCLRSADPLLLRQGEVAAGQALALALRWEDVDLEPGRLMVSWSKGHLTTPKSGWGRSVSLPPGASSALLDLLGERRREGLARGWPEVPEWALLLGGGRHAR
jgi:hypothetical protein